VEPEAVQKGLSSAPVDNLVHLL